MNDATVAAIRKLKDLNGVYVWQPALTAGEPDRLLGYERFDVTFPDGTVTQYGRISRSNATWDRR